MGCLKLHINEQNYLPECGISSPLKPNFTTSKYNLSICKPFLKTCIWSYRFGFNGKEVDDEVKGSGNHYTTHFRQYDPRLGRWFSIDPLVANFPWQSPYVAFDNNPIVFVDSRGSSSENRIINRDIRKNNRKHKKLLLQLTNDIEIKGLTATARLAKRIVWCNKKQAGL